MLVGILTVIGVLLILIGLFMKFFLFPIKYADKKCFLNGPPSYILGNDPLNSCLKDYKTNDDDILYAPSEGGPSGKISSIYKLDPTNIIRIPFILGILILCFSAYKFFK